MKSCPDCLEVVDLHECQACGWKIDLIENLQVWLSSSDKKSELFSSYQANYDVIGGDDLETSIQPIEYLAIQTEYLRSYLGDLSNLNVCELGVGQGLLMKTIIQDDIKKYTGVDICASYLKRHPTSEKVAFLIANAENIPYVNEFDLLVASDILEHVLNVGDFLYSVNRALVMGGKFFVRVPYLEDIGYYSLKRGCKYDFVHLRNFSKESLNVILEGSGFEVERLHYDGYIASRRRKLLRNKLIHKIVSRLFPTDYIPHKINSFLGRLLMRPVEITAVCRKVRDI